MPRLEVLSNPRNAAFYLGYSANIRGVTALNQKALTSETADAMPFDGVILDCGEERFKYMGKVFTEKVYVNYALKGLTVTV